MKTFFTLFCVPHIKAMSNPTIEPYNTNRIKLILEKALDKLNLRIKTKTRREI